MKKGLSTAGVLDQISLGLNAAKRLTKDLEAALDPRVLAAPKSTLTDKAALELYTSFFQDEVSRQGLRVFVRQLACLLAS